MDRAAEERHARRRGLRPSSQCHTNPRPPGEPKVELLGLNVNVSATHPLQGEKRSGAARGGRTVPETQGRPQPRGRGVEKGRRAWTRGAGRDLRRGPRGGRRIRSGSHLRVEGVGWRTRARPRRSRARGIEAGATALRGRRPRRRACLKSRKRRADLAWCVIGPKMAREPLSLVAGDGGQHRGVGPARASSPLRTEGLHGSRSQARVIFHWESSFRAEAAHATPGNLYRHFLLRGSSFDPYPCQTRRVSGTSGVGLKRYWW